MVAQGHWAQQPLSPCILHSWRFRLLSSPYTTPLQLQIAAIKYYSPSWGDISATHKLCAVQEPSAACTHPTREDLSLATALLWVSGQWNWSLSLCGLRCNTPLVKFPVSRFRCIWTSQMVSVGQLTSYAAVSRDFCWVLVHVCSREFAWTQPTAQPVLYCHNPQMGFDLSILSS